MTKEAYLDMCEQLGSQPQEKEIPVMLEDMPIDIELAYNVYNLLPDKIDSFNGVYYGKELDKAPLMLEFLEIQSKKDIFKIIIIIDSLEREEINRRKKDGR
jgi:hypothetical protein